MVGDSFLVGKVAFLNTKLNGIQKTANTKSNWEKAKNKKKEEINNSKRLFIT